MLLKVINLCLTLGYRDRKLETEEAISKLKQ